MSVADYSTTPGSNTSISGIDIAENCAAGNVNGAFRQLMADIKSMYNGLVDPSTLMPKQGGVFSGTQPIYTGRGAYLHNNSNANLSGRVFIQASGGAVPAMADGDWLLEY